MSEMIETKRRRGRLFRRLFLGVYVAVAGTFSVLLFLGVLRGLGGPPQEELPAGAPEVCVDRVEALRGQLLEQIAGLTSSPAGREGIRAYEDWARGFRHRLGAEKKSCRQAAAGDEAQRQALEETFDALRRALDLSEIQATHWARHLGPALERSAASLEAARR